MWRLFSDVHELATGRELQIEEAVNYFGYPTRLASVVEHSGILDDPARRHTFELLLSERRSEL
jgi:hypothetical protein